MRNVKPLSRFVLFFVMACERIFIQTQSIQSRCVIGPENTRLQARPCNILPGNLTGWGSEGVKQGELWKRVAVIILLLYLSSAEHSGRHMVRMHMYTDQCIPQGKSILCVTFYFILLPCHMSTHTPSSGELSAFLEGRCCHARSVSWLKIVPT